MSLIDHYFSKVYPHRASFSALRDICIVVLKPGHQNHLSPCFVILVGTSAMYQNLRTTESVRIKFFCNEQKQCHKQERNLFFLPIKMPRLSPVLELSSMALGIGSIYPVSLLHVAFPYFLSHLIVQLAAGASWIKFEFKPARWWKEIRIHTFPNLRIVQEYAHTTS